MLLKDIYLSSVQKESMLALLWFKSILGLMFFELVSVLFAIVLDYGNEYMTKEKKIETVWKMLHQN